MNGAPDAADLDTEAELGSLSGLAGYHLRRASAALRADYGRSVEADGMRQVLFGILSVISANPDINQSMVGSRLGIQRPNMVALVNDLVQRGWVTRVADPRDGRAFLLRLTNAGEAAAAKTLSRIRAHEQRMLAGISADERGLLIRLLGRVAANGEPSA